jgi:hypothetical protein
LQAPIQLLYKNQKTPRIEDIAWWMSESKLSRNYNLILRIPENDLNYENFQKALLYLQSLGTEFDIFVLTHGMPNYLSAGTGYFYSFKEIDALRGQLSHLRLVFLQSCFGSSLAKDWKEAGAKYIISFDDFNANFAFYDIFLSFSSPNDSVEENYNSAIKNLDFELTKSMPYNFFTAFVQRTASQREKRNVSVEEILKNLKAPVLRK